MLDFLMFYFAGSFAMCSLLLIAHIHFLRNGLHWSKTDFVVYLIAFFLSWLCLLLAVCYFIARRKGL